MAEPAISSKKVPVLLLAFNRPDVTKQVLESISKYAPSVVYVSTDGAREGNKNDKKNCSLVHTYISEWENNNPDVEVRKRYSQVNMGCGNAVSSGIQWFFNKEEMGIILEDDCLPDPSFFTFCETLLNYYKDDYSISHIGGTNLQFGQQRGDGSYYFSLYTHVWGWASWRRAWNFYDFEMRAYPELCKNDPVFARYLCLPMYDATYNKTIDTWDCQWNTSVYYNKSKAIIPNINLVRNIGFEPTATHTPKAPKWYKKITHGSITSIKHPTTTDIDRAADDYTRFNIMQEQKTLMEQIKKTLRGFLKILKN